MWLPLSVLVFVGLWTGLCKKFSNSCHETLSFTTLSEEPAIFSEWSYSNGSCWIIPVGFLVGQHNRRLNLALVSLDLVLSVCGSFFVRVLWCNFVAVWFGLKPQFCTNRIIGYNLSSGMLGPTTLCLKKVCTYFRNICTEIWYLLQNFYDIIHLTLGMLLYYLGKLKFQTFCRYSADMGEKNKKLNF